MPFDPEKVDFNSLPTQDEPEGAVLLGSEHPHGRLREVEFGSDWPNCIGRE